MGKHERGYKRIEKDFYPTPPWVVDALAEHVDLAGRRVWEPACGDGRMAEALKVLGAEVYATDIVDRGYGDERLDFTSDQTPSWPFTDMITNPAYGQGNRLAVRFIESGLRRLNGGLLALLLPVDIDSGMTRTHLFRDCSRFFGKIVLTKRIVWFKHPDKRAEPKENHAWFLWRGTKLWTPPTVVYAPKKEVPGPHPG